MTSIVMDFYDMRWQLQYANDHSHYFPPSFFRLEKEIYDSDFIGGPSDIVLEWLTEHEIEWSMTFHKDDLPGKVSLNFNNEEDAALFILTWS